MKKAVMGWLLVVVMTFTLCSSTSIFLPPEVDGSTVALTSEISHPEPTPPPPFIVDGEYTGFSELPTEYTREQALADGCLVISSPTKYGLSDYWGGIQAWETFLDKSAKGENAFLRVCHFNAIFFYFEDLHYYNGKYYYFSVHNKNPRPYKYLLKLEGVSGSPKQLDVVYALTDNQALTYQDYWYRILRLCSSTISISNSPTVESTPTFVDLTFSLLLPHEKVVMTNDQMMSMVQSMLLPTKECPDLPLSSNPEDYIAAHQKTFDYLVQCQYVAAECFIPVLRQSETQGIDTYIMAAVCSNVTGVGKEGGWSNGEEWLALFDASLASRGL